MVDFYSELVNKYRYLREDGLDERLAGWKLLTDKIGNRFS